MDFCLYNMRHTFLQQTKKPNAKHKNSVNILALSVFFLYSVKYEKNQIKVQNNL